MNAELDVAVVGAGIAGLTVAAELRRAGLTVRVYEATGRIGGRMATVRTQGYTIDTGAEQISSRGYDATWEVMGRIGLDESAAPPIAHPIAVWRKGKPRCGFGSVRGLMTGAGLSARARWELVRRRVHVDPDRPECSPLGATTVAAFGRTLHPDLYDYLLQPAASFCFWDPERSAAAVLFGLQHAVGDTRLWRTYREGMDTVCRRLAAHLDVVTETSVDEVTSDGDRARLRVGGELVTARQVVLCVPAPTAAELYANPPAEEAEFLQACTFSSAVKVALPLDSPVALPGKPYLLITPETEDNRLAGVVFDHLKHPERVPRGCGMITAFPDVRATGALLSAPDDVVVAHVLKSVRTYLPGIRPRTVLVYPHRYALPECTPAALAALGRFRARPSGPVDYAGDWTLLRPHSEGAVRSAAEAASRTLSRLGSPVAV